MPFKKISNSKSIIFNSGITSSNLSSSVNGNMNLIQSQINEKNNNYINVKNAVRILEKYSNWNGYIKLYTEVENNFNINDIIYITYTEPTIDTTRIFNLDNTYNNDIHSYFDNPFANEISQFAFGYKILYVNRYKNELVINRYYNDITPGFVLSNQCLSKISCSNSTLFNDITDGIVLFGSNIFSGDFSKLEGVVNTTGTTSIFLSGATIILPSISFISGKTNNNGYYSLNVPIGNQTIKCYAPGYITKTETTYISTNNINVLNFTLSAGTNSISIFSDNPFNSVCSGGTLTFFAQTIGYDSPVLYQWKLFSDSTWNDVGINSSIFSYDNFDNGDLVKCEVTDVFGVATSDIITVTITTPTIEALPSNVITSGTSVTFSIVTSCSTTPIYKWRLNEYDVSSDPIYINSSLNNGDEVYCEVNGNKSNTITMIVT